MIAGICLGFVLPDFFRPFQCTRVCFLWIFYFCFGLFPSCSLFIVISPPVFWVGTEISWASGAIAYGASDREEIVACVCLKDFSVFTQDTEISWDVD